MCNLREGFVNLREGFVVAPWRLREAFSKTRSAKASRSPLEGFAKASRRRHGRLHLETIRQIMTSPPLSSALLLFFFLACALCYIVPFFLSFSFCFCLVFVLFCFHALVGA